MSTGLGAELNRPYNKTNCAYSEVVKVVVPVDEVMY